MRLAAANEFGIDHTGEIISFSDIGTGVGPASVRPRPWVCTTTDSTNVEWQFPDGTTVPAAAAGSGAATGDQLNTRRFDVRVALYRGPTHNRPDGEHYCVVTTTNERRCVTFSEWSEL